MRILLAVAAVGLTACTQTSSPSPREPVMAPLPSVTATPTSTAGGPPAFDGLPPGPPPRVAWFSGRDVVTPDGGRIRLRMPQHSRISAAATYGEGWLAASDLWFEGTTSLIRFGADGRREWTECSTGQLPAADGLVAWQLWRDLCGEVRSPTTELFLARADGAGPTRHQVVDGWVSPIGVVARSIVYQGPFLGSPRVTDLRSHPSVVPGLGRAYVTGSRGLVAGTMPGAGRTAAVVELGSGRRLWSRQGWLPRSFSPDGELLVIEHPIGAVRSEWTLVQARSGDVVSALGLPRGLLASAFAWEDGARLLVAAYGTAGHTQAILRFDLASRRLAVTTPVVAQPIGFVAGQTRSK